jgi:UDP-N-acetylmuramoyl-L-alanyl-D-glutamate--2,6-diaminopimelate ligase
MTITQPLHALLQALSLSTSVLTPAQRETPIRGVTDDNRKVQPGFLFVAYPGVAVDGHTFIPDVIRRGAAAVVCERSQPGLSVPHVVVENARQALALLCAAWHGYPGRSLVMLGITGTDGKTTTTNLVYSILKAAGLHVGMISTVNAVIGERVLDTGLHTTTPDADEVQGYLAQMRDAGMTHCVLEVTSHGLAHYRVDGVDFDVAVVTNITHEHLNLHGSYEAYRAAKARLFEMAAQPQAGSGLAPAKLAVARASILNADDPFSFEYLRAIRPARQIIYTLEPDAQFEGATTLSLDAVRYAPEGMYLRINTPQGALELHSTLFGAFNISNILAAVAAALALGINTDAIQRGIADLKGVPGRMERIDLGQPFTAIVDFAHTPNALEQFLRTARQLTQGKLIVVFGCAGERDVQKRPMMGRAANAWADHVILTAEDPRRENLDAIIDEIAAGMQPPQATIHRVHDRGEAIRLACALAQPGDIVAACGKGHEQSMCFGVTETPWDDREAMRTAIRAVQG